MVGTVRFMIDDFQFVIYFSECSVLSGPLRFMIYDFTIILTSKYSSGFPRVYTGWLSYLIKFSACCGKMIETQIVISQKCITNKPNTIDPLLFFGIAQ